MCGGKKKAKKVRCEKPKERPAKEPSDVGEKTNSKASNSAFKKMSNMLDAIGNIARRPPSSASSGSDGKQMTKKSRDSQAESHTKKASLTYSKSTIADMPEGSVQSIRLPDTSSSQPIRDSAPFE